MYKNEPAKINITGGNGVGANASVNMKLIDHESSFNSESPSALVGIGSTVSTIGFGTYHKFRNSERIIYKTNGQTAVGGLSTDSSYYVSTVSPYVVKLHKTLDDAVSGTVAALECPISNGEIYHLGSSQEITIEQLIKESGKFFKYEGSYIEAPTFPGSTARRCPDITKSNLHFGFEPQVDWVDSLKKTLTWYQNFFNSGSHAFESSFEKPNV